MGRLWTTGNELQSGSTFEFTSIISNAPAVETTIKRSGNAAWRISNVSATEGFRQIYTPAITQGDFYFRFYLYIVALPTLTAIIGGFRQTGTNKAVVRMTATGALQLYNVEDSAQVGSDSAALSTATWYRIEIKCDTTTLSSTAVDARIDGVSFASGTIDITANPNNVFCHVFNGDLTLDFVVDDLAVNDASGSFENTWPGEGEVIILRPNATGDNAAWTRGGSSDTGANWSQCNETPPDDATTYVESNTSGQIDDYEFDDTPAALGSTDTINCVQVGVRAAVSDATSTDPDMVLRIKSAAAGTVEESAALDVNSVTWQSPAPLPALGVYVLTLYDLPGASTTAWTKATLDTLQAGFRESATDAHFARVSAIWVMVDHKPGAAVSAPKNLPSLGVG